MGEISSNNLSPKEEIALICHKLYVQNYLVATSGNISVKTRDKILITPRAMRKDQVQAQSIVECDQTGKVISTHLSPSSEIALHLKVYELRKDIQAAIHAHPQYCTICSLTSISLEKIFLPEMAAYLGPIPTIPYKTPGSAELALAAGPLLLKHNAMLMERHGVLVLGRNLAEAFNRLEHLEHVAKIAYLSSLKNPPEALNPEEINKIEKLARQ